MKQLPIRNEEGSFTFVAISAIMKGIIEARIDSSGHRTSEQAGTVATEKKSKSHSTFEASDILLTRLQEARLHFKIKL